MNPNPSKAELDEENYQVEHGSKSLAPCIDLATSRVATEANKDRALGQWFQTNDVESLLNRPTLGKPKSNGLGGSSQF